jgi:ribonuclease HII
VISLDFENELHYSGVVAGIDEAGRGPWAGPVVAAAVILDRKCFPAGINDSKKLSKTRREALYELIMKDAIVGIGICSVEEIDQYNILGATKHAMLRAYDALPAKPDIVLVDGNQLPSLPCKMDAVVGGDALCASIAAASIIAKVTRDNIMIELAKEFPHYGFERNVGYGTKSHQDGLALFGVTPHHRRSFAPIRKLLEQQSSKVA